MTPTDLLLLPLPQNNSSSGTSNSGAHRRITVDSSSTTPITGNMTDVANTTTNNGAIVGYNASASSSENTSSFTLAGSVIAPPRSPEDLNVRLRAAMAIAKTLSEFHAGGVAHNKLSPENIVLDTFEGDYVATLIDLSEAVIFADVSLEDEEARVAFERTKRQEDLKALGGVFKQLFRGFDDESGKNAIRSIVNTYGTSNSGNAYTPSTALTLSNGGEEPFETWGDETRRKRNKAPSAEAEGLPIYLGSVISTLLLAGSENGNSSTPASTVQYESAKDVYLDLKVMLESNNQLYRQIELDERMVGSRLLLPSVFYGRQVQMSMLMHLYHSVVMMGNQPSIATISGQ